MTPSERPAAPRILFLAIDAGDKDLIREWADAGYLPTFRALRERGAWALTENPTGLFVGAIWPSFWTGLSPGRHGRYCYTQIRPGTYEQVSISPEFTRGEPFWDALDRAGRRVAILDLPKTRLSSMRHGIQVVDWGTHDSELRFQTSPEPLAAEITERFGRYPVESCDALVKRGPEAATELRDALVAGIETRTRLAEDLLARERWDLFLAVFAESHCAGHQLWSLHDPRHPRHDPERARSAGDPLRDVYRALDAAIARLIAQAGPETAVFVLASHGMGPHYDGTFLLDRILQSLFGKEAGRPARRGAARLAETAWRFVPEAARGWLRPFRRRVRTALADAVTRPERSALPCFTTPNNDVYGGLRINLVGREPEGKVEPGAPLEAFTEELTRDLLAFVNAGTGRPLVRRVLRTADLYDGDRLSDLPDLLVEWDRDDPITEIHSPKTGTIRGVFGGNRTGDHKPEGMLFAFGPGIAPGPLPRPVSILEMAPTIASRLGVRLEDVDGAPVPELLDDPGRASAASTISLASPEKR
jgi:predicted AlkP superfamily phosphohydrolase/phosphomutase